MSRDTELPPVTDLEHNLAQRLEAAQKELSAAKHAAQQHCAHHGVGVGEYGMRCSACGASIYSSHGPYCECGRARPAALEVCWWCYAEQEKGDT